MAAKTPFNSQKVFCAVTGASRGIGRTIAVELARRLPSGSLCLLLARSFSGLEETRKLATAVNPKINFISKSVDFSQSKEEDMKKVISECLNGRQPSDFDQVIIVHNAGSIGDVSEPASKMESISKWQEYYTLNVFSVAVLNSEFLKIFTADEVKNRLIINITSKCGQLPFKSLAYYCSGKAAREMYFRVLAIEEGEKLAILNYSPGPVETDMFNEIIQNTADEDTLKEFKEMLDKKVVLTCNQTVSKLIDILEKGTYNSGDHIDYFDYQN